MKSAVIALAGAASLIAQSSQPGDSGVEFFEKKIRPVFAARCFACHSSAAPKVQGGLQLDSRDALRKGGNSGSPITPGDPDSSLLIKALRYNDPNLKMPPGKALPPEVVADFEQWIRLGAPDPRTDAPMKASNKSRDWWAFKKPARPPVPQVSDPSWPKTPLDNFILAKLAEAKLKPSAPAGRRTLIRRASFDLIGLPPTQAEIDAFAKDTASNAFEKVVDRLLASPQYGVRWARRWMDISRYADTADGPDRFAFSYTYRDWLIRAFNADLPYNQFVMKQLAADQLTDNQPRDLAALGFITLGHTVPKGDPDTIDDRIDVITRGLLGMTVTCARCHDHKFDPIPTRDYYSLYGVIANTVQPVEYPLIAHQDETSPLVQQYRGGMRRRLDKLHEFETKRHAQLVAELRTAPWISRYILGAQTALTKSNQEIEALSRNKDFNLFMLRRWRAYLLAAREKRDPVFAIWNLLASVPPDPAKPDADESVCPTAPLKGLREAGTGASACWLNFPRLLSGGTKDLPDRFAPRAAESLKALPSNTNQALANAFLANPPVSLEDTAKIYGEVLAKFDSPEVNADATAEPLRLVLRGLGTPTNVPLEDFDQIRGPGGDANIQGGLEGAIREWEAEFGYRGIAPRAMVLLEAPKLAPAHVFIRGNPNNPGAETPPHFLSALVDGDLRPFTHGSGRLDLAEAIVDPNNPVTARVIVNRVWQWHFGRGIVASSSDFGARGDLPSHPALLDYLATRFMEEGWSIKKLQKWIMLSSAYQQSSADRPDARAADPENKLVWRMNRQRLDFESLHDSILYVSGDLDLTVGGLPFSLMAQPPVPRRAAYAYIQRGHLPGELSAFDFAIPDSHVPQRFLTTVPQQALYLMNSPFILTESKHLVAHTGAGVDKLYRGIYGRPATVGEVQAALQYIHGETTHAPRAIPSAWRYGLVSLDGSFQPLQYFVEQNWQAASITPQPVFGNAHLSATKGAPPDDPSKGIVRRWVAPMAGTVEISGTLCHKLIDKPDEYQKQWSDGIHVRIVLNRSGKLADQIVNNTKVELAVKAVAVRAGDTIDFVVDCVKDSENDDFEWAPVVKMDQQTWDAKKDFAGPAPVSLNPWEKLAQVLLQTSEFAFVD